MPEALTRATHLMLLLSARRSSAQAGLGHAVVSCCSELIAAGESRTALQLASLALELESQEVRSELIALRASALYELGRYSESLGCCDELLAKANPIEASPLPRVLELRVLRSANLWQMGHGNGAVAELELLRAELLKWPDSAALARCALHLQAASIIDGRYHEARDWCMEAVVSARRAGDRLTEAVAIDNLARLERYYCRWAISEDYGRVAQDIFQELGNRSRGHISRRSQAITLWKRGRLEAASQLAHACVSEAKEIGNASFVAYSELLASAIMLHLGDARGSLRIVSDIDLSDLPVNHKAVLLALEFMADVEMELGNAKRSLELLDECVRSAENGYGYADIDGELRRRRADALLNLGRCDAARSEAEAAVSLTRKLGDRYEEAATYRVLAMASAALGRHDEARQWFQQGFAYYDDIETPYEWGRLWMAYGDWLSGPQAADADSPAALRAYMSARDLFERMGALGKLAEVNARIDKLTQPGGSPALELVTPAQTRRRRRPTADVERRSTWALDNFGIVTRQVAVLDLLEEVEKFAPTDSPILILGESGTGKELVARGVHRLSGRRGQFIAINCAAMPREIIESELFGHVAGSFTGASKDRSGLLEDCEHGTVFLDEIGEMALDLQARLLRFLESGEVRRVGSSRNRTLDTRVVAATNRDRMSLEHGERFRADLYYRLAHAVVTLPPVRRRGEDVELLIHHFMEEACRREKKQVRLTDRALDRMVGYAWPGNVRQMRSVIRRAVILARPDSEIDLEALQLDDPRFPATLSEELEHAERQRVIEALRQANGSRTLAAKALGIPRTTLLNKMKRFGIT